VGIRAEHLSYTYGGGTAFEQPALRDVSFEIPDGQFVGLIGHTGSGKSTLIQHLNGLIRATEGKLFVDGENIYEKGYNMRALRTKVGLVFQYPEHQLFEIDVFKDVCFGPKNMGLPQAEIEQRAKEALAMVGLTEKFYKKSPFELSGGQKRRVAIAGVLAMKPKVLVLDEPNSEWGLTVILVSHSMEDVAKYAERLLVMSGGEKRFDGTPKEVFKHYEELEELGLSAPQVSYLVQRLRRAGMPLSDEITTVAEARDALRELLKGGAPC